MSTSTFSNFTNILGFVAAVTSLSVSFINICLSQLPSHMIKELESLIDGTDTLFKKAVEDGLLMEGFVQQTERHLTMLRMLTYHLQSHVYNATTLRQDCLELLKGTSRSIGTTCQSLRELRAQIITCSVERSCTLMETQTPHSPALPLTPDPECHPSPLGSTHVPRPRSCPPVLSGWRSDEVQHGFAQGNPFRDPTKSESDVRTTDVQNSTSIIHTSVTLEPEA